MQRCASLAAHTTPREVSPDQAHKYESYTAHEGEITLRAWTHNAPTAPAATTLPPNLIKGKTAHHGILRDAIVGCISVDNATRHAGNITEEAYLGGGDIDGDRNNRSAGYRPHGTGHHTTGFHTASLGASDCRERHPGW